jgi:hypothetical protein
MEQSQDLMQQNHQWMKSNTPKNTSIKPHSEHNSNKYKAHNTVYIYKILLRFRHNTKLNEHRQTTHFTEQTQYSVIRTSHEINDCKTIQAWGLSVKHNSQTINPNGWEVHTHVLGCDKVQTQQIHQEMGVVHRYTKQRTCAYKIKQGCTDVLISTGFQQETPNRVCESCWELFGWGEQIWTFPIGQGQVFPCSRCYIRVSSCSRKAPFVQASCTFEMEELAEGSAQREIMTESPLTSVVQIAIKLYSVRKWHTNFFYQPPLQHAIHITAKKQPCV